MSSAGQIPNLPNQAAANKRKKKNRERPFFFFKKKQKKQKNKTVFNMLKWFMYTLNNFFAAMAKQRDEIEYKID